MNIFICIMESWRVIPKFPNYSASNLGRIKNNKTEKILKGGMDGGYCRISIKDINKKISNQSMHVLVAMTWIPNPENKPTVNHINKIRHDNRAENLEWLTMREQIKHSLEFDKNNGITRKNNSYRGLW